MLSSSSNSDLTSASTRSVTDVACALDNPEGFSIEAFEDSLRLYRKINDVSTDDPNCHSYKHALEVLMDAFRLFGSVATLGLVPVVPPNPSPNFPFTCSIRPENVYGSYNGGKDAVVIMHLMRAALAQYSMKKVLLVPRTLISRFF
jgi:hypothetical protein